MLVSAKIRRLSLDIASHLSCSESESVFVLFKAAAYKKQGMQRPRNTAESLAVMATSTIKFKFASVHHQTPTEAEARDNPRQSLNWEGGFIVHLRTRITVKVIAYCIEMYHFTW